MDISALKAWFTCEKRDLPWRKDPTPYRVWVSEVMLQQTQVAVVIGYFERWMQLFPTVTALAKAPLDQVIKAWEGLGYYSRARNLHAGASFIEKHYQGDLPSSREELEKIKGLGPYTVGAILSFAFHQKAAAVDGNVKRLLARYFLIEEDLQSVRVQKQMAKMTEDLLPDVESWVVMEALIELGSQICSKLPKCSLCPLQEGCLAYRFGKSSELPIKKKKTAYVNLQRDVAVLIYEDEVLLRRETSGKIMADLYEFPYFEKTDHLDFLKKLLVDLTGSPVEYCSNLSEINQTFTRFRVKLYPTLWKVLKKRPLKDYDWIPMKEVAKLPFSSGHRHIINILR